MSSKMGVPFFIPTSSEWKFLLLIICVFLKYFILSGLSSHCLDIAFHRAEVFNYTEVQLINYFFCAWSVVQKPSSPCTRSNSGSLNFLLRVFQVLYSLCFTFKSLIYSELIFVQYIRPVSRLIFCMWMSSYSSISVVKGCLLLCISSTPLSTIFCLYLCGLFLDLYSVH